MKILGLYPSKRSHTLGAVNATAEGIRSAALAEDLLVSGGVDFIALSRPFIREPNLINKWRADSAHRVTSIF